MKRIFLLFIAAGLSAAAPAQAKNIKLETALANAAYAAGKADAICRLRPFIRQGLDTAAMQAAKISIEKHDRGMAMFLLEEVNPDCAKTLTSIQTK